MTLAMIAAMAHHRVIGSGNTMPWHLPEDLAYFKQVTMGKPVIMGRKTFESIGRPLPQRVNIIISGQTDFSPLGVEVVATPEQALALALSYPARDNEVMVIGGGTIYQQFLPSCQKLYLTFIDSDVSGDTFFPDYTASDDWHCLRGDTRTSEHGRGLRYRFDVLTRQAGGK